MCFETHRVEMYPGLHTQPPNSGMQGAISWLLVTPASCKKCCQHAEPVNNFRNTMCFLCTEHLHISSWDVVSQSIISMREPIGKTRRIQFYAVNLQPVRICEWLCPKKHRHEKFLKKNREFVRRVENQKEERLSARERNAVHPCTRTFGENNRVLNLPSSAYLPTSAYDSENEKKL
jgi:hypothetical protein